MGPAGASQEHFVALGVRCKGAEAENDPGHAWITFGRNHAEIEVRGYYPVLPGVDYETIQAMPSEAQLMVVGAHYNKLFPSIRSFARFFAENEVDGMILRDILSELVRVQLLQLDRRIAQDIELRRIREEHTLPRRPKDKFYAGRRFGLGLQRFDELATHCDIPHGRDSLRRGRYGLRIHLPHVNNCVSWATRTVRSFVSEADDIPVNTASVKDIWSWLNKDEAAE